MVLRPRPSTGEAELPVRGSGAATRTIIPLPAAEYQVFEVTDLLIPSGTDLSNEGHVIGSLTYEPIKTYVYSLYFELADAIGDSDELILDGGFVSLDLAGSVAPTSKAMLGQGVYALLSGGSGPSDNSLDTSSSKDVALWTGGPTTADITVVRARVALLAI